MRLILLILLVIFTLYPIGSSGDRTELADFSGNPSYTLLILTNKTILNPGDHVKIELFFTGIGDVEISKIYVNIPKQLPQNGTVYYKIREYNYTKNTGKVHISYNTYKHPNEFYQIISRYTYEMVDLGDVKFETISQGFNYTGSSGLILGETRSESNGYAPNTIDFIIADNTQPGDYRVSIIYTYGNSGIWNQYEGFVNLHVNHFYERDEFKLIVYIVTLSTGLAGLSYIRKFLKWAWSLLMVF